MSIQAGDAVRVRDAFGEWHDRTATSGRVPGHDMMVVWVQRPGADPVPWPAEDVRLAERTEP